MSHVNSAFLGDFYARWTLDCLVEIAHAISIDYFSHPEFYKGDDTPDKIVELWLSYGSAKNFPNNDQRHVLAGAIFGDSDGYPPKGAASYSDDFHQKRDTLFKLCIAAQTATSAQSRVGLNQSVQVALPTFQDYLRSFAGKAARLAHDQIVAVTASGFAVLRSDTVASRFIGIHSGIDKEWPLKKSDPNGDMLIPECISKLEIAFPEAQADFSRLRELAQAGQEALDAIVQATPDLDDIIRKIYSWAMFSGRYEPYSGK